MFKLLYHPRISLNLVIFIVLLSVGSRMAYAQEDSLERSPARNPPMITAPAGLPYDLPARISTTIGAPSMEWTLHKTADGLHPDGREQQVMWLMNRARANPPAEGYWLATTTEPDIAGGRDYFNVDTTVLQNEFNSYAAKPPAAFDVRLYNAARAHSDYMIAVDTQTHEGQFDRVAAAGFHYGSLRGSIFVWADNGLNAHGAWNIDWGSGTVDGMQTSRGHRKAIMSLDGDYTNVGVALVHETNQATSVGPYVTTGNYGSANPSYADHFNQFIIGTVWRDLNGNYRYDPGEGVGGVTVRPNMGTYYAVTGVAGGYAIPVTMAPGTYPVTFSGGVSGSKSVTIGSGSALLDLLAGSAPPPVYNHWLYLPMVVH